MFLASDKELSIDNSRKSIVVQTRAGTSIENQQCRELPHRDWCIAADLIKTHKDLSAKPLCGPCPIYNCHGLVFASRRTQLSPESANFEKIISEDDYFEILEKDVQPGDIIFYYDENDQSIEHSGIVVEVREAKGIGIKVPWIWSKWGHAHEYLHHYANCPYPKARRFFRMKSWNQNP
ncbi:MAG: hypothetical protein ABSA16_17025 [Thermoguttaceae bacterium]|jgi:hypothetical protein